MKRARDLDTKIKKKKHERIRNLTVEELTASERRGDSEEKEL